MALFATQVCLQIGGISFAEKPTLPETNIAYENPIFPGKYHQNGGSSMAMLVSWRVSLGSMFLFQRSQFPKNSLPQTSGFSPKNHRSEPLETSGNPHRRLG